MFLCVLRRPFSGDFDGDCWPCQHRYNRIWTLKHYIQFEIQSCMADCTCQRCWRVYLKKVIRAVELERWPCVCYRPHCCGAATLRSTSREYAGLPSSKMHTDLFRMWDDLFAILYISLFCYLCCMICLQSHWFGRFSSVSKYPPQPVLKLFSFACPFFRFGGDSLMWCLQFQHHWQERALKDHGASMEVCACDCCVPWIYRVHGVRGVHVHPAVTLWMILKWDWSNIELYDEWMTEWKKGARWRANFGNSHAVI